MADIHKPLSIAALVLIGASILVTIASGSWFFAIGPEPLPVEGSVHAQAPQEPQISVEQVAAMHLFGQPVANAVPDTENLRETRLSLVLAGVFVADDPAGSKALIAQKGGPARSYGINDRLPGNVHLHSVHRDRVVLNRGGVHELLRFEEGARIIRRVETPDRPSAPKRRATPELRSGQSIKQAFLENRQDIDRDPRGFLTNLGLRTSADGGYVLGAFADNDAFLEPTDRILSVNGRPVGNPEEDHEQLEDIIAGGSVDVEVQRGKQRIKFTLSLDSLN